MSYEEDLPGKQVKKTRSEAVSDNKGESMLGSEEEQEVEVDRWKKTMVALSSSPSPL